MSEQIGGRAAVLEELTLRALVVGSDNDGVAIIGTKNHIGQPLRSGSVLNQKIGGVNIPLAVSAIDAAGIRFKTTGTRGEEIVIPGSFKPLATDENHDAEDTSYLRYVEFSDIPMETALRLIADQSGINISASRITAERPVSVFLRGVSAKTAVEEICRATGLWFRDDSSAGVVRVTTMEEYQQSLASFREEETETYTLLYPNVIEVASVIYGLYPERVMLSLGEDEILDSDEDDISRRFSRFNAIADSGGSSFLKMNAGSTSAGGSSGSSALNFNGGRISVVPQLGQLTQADAARINAAEAEGTNSLSTILGKYNTQNANIFVTISRKNSMLMVRTSDSKAMEDIRALIKRLDVPTPMVLLEVKVLELQLEDGFSSSVELGGNFIAGTTSEHTTKYDLGFQGLDPVRTKDGRSDTMSFRLLSDHIQARIQLLETEGNAKTIATPMLLTANNEVSRLFIGEERPMVKNITSQTIANGETTITIPQTEIEFQSVGTMLLITPNINADRTVTLRLLQENSEINQGAASIPVYSLSDGGLVQNVAVDVISSRSVTGTFVAKDEMTIAVGGLIKETETEYEDRIPVLGRIPLLGWLFKSVEKKKQRTELIILIKPHVISTPSDSGETGRKILRELSEHPYIQDN